MIFGKVRVEPHTRLSILVESDEGVIHTKGSHFGKQLIETQEDLTKGVDSLLMAKTARVNQPERNVFCEDSDVLVVGAVVSPRFIVGSVNLDQRLFTVVTVVVSV